MLAAHTAGFVVAVLNSFILNSMWTFKGEGGFSWRPAPSFFAVAVSAWLLSTFLLWLLQGFMPVIVAKIVVIGATVVYGYVANALIVFRQKS